MIETVLGGLVQGGMLLCLCLAIFKHTTGATEPRWLWKLLLIED